MLTDPVHVAVAELGDVLQIDILLLDRWGYAKNMPQRGTCRLPRGTEIEPTPFIGVVAVAPPPHWDRRSSIQPRRFADNMEKKELRAGATLNQRVLNPGAQTYAGDGHAVRGNDWSA